LYPPQPQSKDDADGIWISRRYSYLLAAEGVAYFLLALMDFLTHIVPALHENLFVFKIVDIILGS